MLLWLEIVQVESSLLELPPSCLINCFESRSNTRLVFVQISTGWTRIISTTTRLLNPIVAALIFFLDITYVHLFDFLLGVLYGCETGPPAFNYWFPESEGFEL